MHPSSMDAEMECGVFVQSSVHCVCISKSEIEEAHVQFGSPVVAFRLASQVVLALFAIAFINEVKRLTVILLLERTGHFSLLLLS